MGLTREGTREMLIQRKRKIEKDRDRDRKRESGKNRKDRGN